MKVFCEVIWASGNSVADGQDISDSPHHLSLPLWANCMTGTHVTLETTYSTSVENQSESLRVSEVSVTKKISCYTTGSRDS